MFGKGTFEGTVFYFINCYVLYEKLNNKMHLFHQKIVSNVRGIEPYKIYTVLELTVEVA